MFSYCKVIILLIFFVANIAAACADSSVIEINANKLEKGILVNVPVNGFPLFILNRRLEEIEDLNQLHKDKLNSVSNCKDCDTILRSISKDILVVWGFNPSSGCDLIYVSSKDLNGWEEYGLTNRGGFVDKCSNTVFDLSGRILPNSSKSDNYALEVPVYTYDEGVIRIQKSSYPAHPTDIET